MRSYESTAALAIVVLVTLGATLGFVACNPYSGAASGQSTVDGGVAIADGGTSNATEAGPCVFTSSHFDDGCKFGQ